MARHLRRLTLWLLAGIATLLLLALCALAALWWGLDPNDCRSQMEVRATALIGRPVHLSGRLRWQLGKQVLIVSEGGEISNAAGFGSAPLLHWSRLQLGVALWPLLHRRVLVDRIEIDGLQLRLERNAQGLGNWHLPFDSSAGDAARASVVFRVGAVRLANGDIRFQDGSSGTDWQVSELAFDAQLPQDLAATEREFRVLHLAGLVAGGPIAPAGVRISMRADTLRLSPQQLQIPAAQLQWADAVVNGSVTARLDATADTTAHINLQAPSLRALLASVGVASPPMSDSTVFGNLQLQTTVHYVAGALSFEALSMALDDTHLRGALSLPRLKPLALRFDLVADRVDLDRYREPVKVRSEPFELPLPQLKALDAKGVLRIRRARVAGVAATELRVDVE